MIREHAKAAPLLVGAGRSVVWFVVLVAALAAFAYQAIDGGARGMPAWQGVGHDFELYRDAAARWLATGVYFEPYQFAPYPVVEREILYPPTALLLFVPFTVLPPVLWWAVPLGIIGWVVWSWRPALWAWAVIAVLFAAPVQFGLSWTLHVLLNGNPVLWSAAALALATRYPMFGSWVAMKPAPVMLPFALWGVRSKGWWAGLAVAALLSVPFLELWLDYAVVLRNAQGAGVLYALSGVPLTLVPVVAWLGRSRPGALDDNQVR